MPRNSVGGFLSLPINNAKARRSGKRAWTPFAVTALASAWPARNSAMVLCMNSKLSPSPRNSGVSRLSLSKFGFSLTSCMVINARRSASSGGVPCERQIARVPESSCKSAIFPVISIILSGELRS